MGHGDSIKSFRFKRSTKKKIKTLIIGKYTITSMINIYCRKKHGNEKGELCQECSELLDYAHKRLDFCKFGEVKSFYSKCPIHCYKKDMKIKIKGVMKF